jgi:ABC-type nitrate/sulfonate/bicarbonate transport system substrate-binding protein
MRDYLKKSPAVVDRFLKALVDAESFINANPAETIKIIADAVQMDVATMTGIRSNFDFKLGLDADIIKLMKKQADWDASSGKPANVSDIDRTLRGLVELEHLRRIAPDRISGF